MKKNTDKVIKDLKAAAVHFHLAGGHDHEYGQEEMALAKAIKVMEEYKVNPPPSRWQLFLQGIAKPFINAWQRFFPLPLEKVQAPPVGYKSWADVPKRLRHANPLQGTANPVKLNPWEDTSKHGYGSNVLVSIKGDGAMAFLGDDTAIPMVTPEKFGLTPRQAEAVRAGKGYEWGKDSEKTLRANRVANVQLSTLVGVIGKNPPKTQEEAQTMLKLLEGSMGKSAGAFLAEAAAAKAKADETQDDAANDAARDALLMLGDEEIQATVLDPERATEHFYPDDKDFDRL